MSLLFFTFITAEMVFEIAVSNFFICFDIGVHIARIEAFNEIFFNPAGYFFVYRSFRNFLNIRNILNIWKCELRELCMYNENEDDFLKRFDPKFRPTNLEITIQLSETSCRKFFPT